MTDRLDKVPGSRWTQTANRLRQPILWLLGAVIAGVLLWLNGPGILHLLERADQARVWIAGFGPLAPLAYICLNTAQVVVAPFPGNFMGVVSGYLFGIFWGTLYSIIGLSIGATIAICIGRFLGRPILVRFFDECSLREWEGKLRMRSPALWALVFLFPVPDLLIYMAGMSSVPLRWLLPAIVFGRGIGIMLANIVGGWSAKLPPEWLLVKWIVLTAIALIVFQYQRDIRLYLLLGYRRLRRLTRRSFWTRPVSARQTQSSLSTYASGTAASSELGD